jgi:hypothetical protein
MDCIENDGNNSSVVACIFVAVGTYLLRCCIATVRGIYI